MLNDNLGDLKNKVASIFTECESYIKKLVVAQQFNINKNLETLYKELLSIAFNTSLENANTGNTNAKGIDLVAKNEGIVFQVTSDSSTTKIQESIKKVVEEIEDGKDYKELYMMMIAGKESYPYVDFSKNTNDKIVFKKDDHILDNQDLIKKLRDEGLEKWKTFCASLEKYLLDEMAARFVENSKAYSILTNLASILAENFDINNPNKDRHLPPEVEEKIKHNDLKTYAGIVGKYGLFGSFILHTYTNIESQNPKAIKNINNFINDKYLEAKGELLGVNLTIDSIRNNSDEIFKTTFVKLKNHLESKTLDFQYSDEELEIAITIIMVKGFIDCYILENPNNT